MCHRNDQVHVLLLPRGFLANSGERPRIERAWKQIHGLDHQWQKKKKGKVEPLNPAFFWKALWIDKTQKNSSSLTIHRLPGWHAGVNEVPHFLGYLALSQEPETWRLGMFSPPVSRWFRWFQHHLLTGPAGGVPSHFAKSICLGGSATS